MKLLWVGTDVLCQLRYPPYIQLRFRVKIFFERIIARLIQPFIERNIAVSEGLKKDLEGIGYKNIIIRPDPVKYTEVYPKVEHVGVNVLYYIPRGKRNQKFTEWLYGWDVWQDYKKSHSDYNFIEVNGLHDMSKVYPIIDLYFRPTRYDGASRMVQECKIQGIPTIHFMAVFMAALITQPRRISKSWDIWMEFKQ